MKYFKKNQQQNEDFTIPDRQFAQISKDEMKRLPPEVSGLIKDYETYINDIKNVMKSKQYIIYRRRKQVYGYEE